MKKGILFKVRIFSCFVLALFGFGVESAIAQTAEYATFTGDASTGTGSFTCNAMPDFTYTISGDVASGDTAVPGEQQTVDNDGGGMELIYGQADQQQNIEVEVAGYGGGNGGGIGDPITNTVTTTIAFTSATPAGSLAFLIADVEQDQVMICAQDANGVDVPNSVIARWFKSSFDACDGCPDENLTEGISVPPTWDAANATLVGQYGSGVKATNYVADLPDNEAGAAWFEVDISIRQLQFKSQAMGVNPDDPSQHFFIATTCKEPCPDPNCAEIVIKN